MARLRRDETANTFVGEPNVRSVRKEAWVLDKLRQQPSRLRIGR